MKITAITIVTNPHAADHVSLQTDFVEACWPFREFLCLTFRAAHGQGEAYVQQHFPDIPVTVVHSGS